MKEMRFAAANPCVNIKWIELAGLARRRFSDRAHSRICDPVSCPFAEGLKRIALVDRRSAKSGIAVEIRENPLDCKGILVLRDNLGAQGIQGQFLSQCQL